MEGLSKDDRLKKLRYLYATVFITSTVYGSATFLLPVLAKGLGASYVQLGLMGAVGNIIYTVMTLFTGLLLDQFERVRLYLAFTSIGVCVMFLFIITNNVSEIIIMRGVLGIISGTFWVTASTIIADLSPSEELTRSVGKYNISWISGFVVGPIIGGIISDAFNFPTLFAVLAAINIASSVIIFFRLTSLRLKHASSTAWTSISSVRPILNAYSILLPYAIILGIYMAILPGHMEEIGISVTAIGLLLTLTNGVRGLGFLSSERWVKWGAKRSLWLSSFLMCGALFMVFFSKEAFEFALPLTIFGFAGGIFTPIILDYVAHKTPKEYLGMAMGLHECVYGIGMSIGPMVGGAIAEAFRPSVLYLLLAALSIFIIPLSMSIKS